MSARQEIIDVELKTRRADFDKCGCALLAIGVFSDAKTVSRAYTGLDEKLGGAVKRLIELGDFKAKVGETSVIYGNEKTDAQRILLVGLGEKKKLTLDTLRKTAATAAGKSVDLKSGRLVLALHQQAPKRLEAKKTGQALAEGACYGSYRYDEFVTEEKEGRLKKLVVEVVDSNAAVARKLTEGVKVGNIIGQAQSFARTIANRPGNVINPAALAAEAKKMAQKFPGLGCTVFDEKQLKQKKMGGILAVGSGSASEPRLIVLKYSPAAKKSKKNPAVGLVGKAITFDSGGISIKPSAGMEEMKLDKSGGIAVLAAMRAIAQLKPAIEVFGIIPAAENMPGPKSYRPGDIVTTYSGKTVEVQNTDAEGRMILCDAIHYAVEQNCRTIVDIATLTGACMVALGTHKAGLMGNDDKLIRKLQAASETSGEKLWHMPSGQEYLDEMKSKIADLKNVGGKWGGACTGAAFLGSFAADAKWAHIDMAGVDMFKGNNKSAVVGATGFGVRLLTEFVMNLVN